MKSKQCAHVPNVTLHSTNAFEIISKLSPWACRRNDNGKNHNLSYVFKGFFFCKTQSSRSGTTVIKPSHRVILLFLHSSKTRFRVFLRIFLKICNKGPPESVCTIASSTFKRNWSAQKGPEMLKKIMTDIRAAITLIATENVNALRVLLKNITNLASKSIRAYKKT